MRSAYLILKLSTTAGYPLIGGWFVSPRTADELNTSGIGTFAQVLHEVESDYPDAAKLVLRRIESARYAWLKRVTRAEL